MLIVVYLLWLFLILYFVRENHVFLGVFFITVKLHTCFSHIASMTFLLLSSLS
jgi:hypothetical protein